MTPVSRWRPNGVMLQWMAITSKKRRRLNGSELNRDIIAGTPFTNRIGDEKAAA